MFHGFSENLDDKSQSICGLAFFIYACAKFISFGISSQVRPFKTDFLTESRTKTDVSVQIRESAIESVMPSSYLLAFHLIYDLA